jgi:DNA mismatch repair protein MutS2
LEIIESIDAVFDAKGQVRSNASAKLIHIREEMVRLRRAINRQFLKDLKRFKERGWLADTNEGFINNRRVLAVNSTHKRKVSGTALGQSKNGSITFIEPAANVSMNFEMEMLLDDERKEILRILRALTAQTRKHLPLFRAYHVLLVELDWIRAKMQLAVEMEADMPGLRQDCSFHLDSRLPSAVGDAKQAQWGSYRTTDHRAFKEGPNVGDFRTKCRRKVHRPQNGWTAPGNAPKWPIGARSPQQ